MLFHRRVLEIARPMHVDRLQHRLEPDARVGLAVFGFDRVDRGAGKEEDVLRDPLRFQILQIQD